MGWCRRRTSSVLTAPSFAHIRSLLVTRLKVNHPVSEESQLLAGPGSSGGFLVVSTTRTEDDASPTEERQHAGRAIARVPQCARSDRGSWQLSGGGTMVWSTTVRRSCYRSATWNLRELAGEISTKADAALTPLRVVVAFTLTAALALVCCELAFGWVRQWLAARPATVAVAVGLIFLVLTVFLVECWLALKESERWRAPAVAALDAYIHSADDVAQQVYSHVYELVAALPAPANAVTGPAGASSGASRR